MQHSILVCIQAQTYDLLGGFRPQSHQRLTKQCNMSVETVHVPPTHQTFNPVVFELFCGSKKTGEKHDTVHKIRVYAGRTIQQENNGFVGDVLLCNWPLMTHGHSKRRLQSYTVSDVQLAKEYTSELQRPQKYHAGNARTGQHGLRVFFPAML